MNATHVVAVDEPSAIETVSTWVWVGGLAPADVGYASVARVPRSRVELGGRRLTLLGCARDWCFYAEEA